jgi:alpha-galactosidase
MTSHRTRRCRAALAALILVAGAGLAAVGGAAAPARALDNGLARTPPMGWDDWNAYQCNNNATDVEQTARFIHDSGLQADGYKYVIIDGCWNDLVGQGTADPNGAPITGPLPAEACGAVNGRLPDGQIFVNTTEFPPSSPCANDGIKRVAGYVHSLGLKLGLWIDATNNWNCQEIPGSYGFDSTDASTLASWGVDYVKADWCGGNPAPPQGDPYGGPTFFNQPNLPTDHQQLAEIMYEALGKALAATGRPIVYSMCNGYDSAVQPQTWAQPVANMWRTTGDISDTFASMVSIVNANDQYAADAGPGGWNDPDMLEIGNGGMTRTEDESEFSLWAEMAAPLIMGTNLVSPAGGAQQQAYDLSIFGNRQVIAVDQDPLGAQGRIVSFDGTHLVLAKPLADGDVSVVLFNEGSTPAVISTTAGAAGLPADSVYTLDNLWTHRVTETAGAISAYVAPHQTVMYRVAAPRGPALGQAYRDAPDVTLAFTGNPAAAITAASPVQLTATLTNNGVTPVRLRGLTLQTPSGWSVTGGLSGPQELGTGQSASAVFAAESPPPSVPVASVTLTASGSYSDVAGLESATAELPESVVSPVSAPYLTVDTTSGPPAVLGELNGQFAIDAAGTGVAAPGFRPGSDSYAMIYLPGGADTGAVATTEVTSLASGRGAQAGLQMRNAAGGSPAGVALYVNGSGLVVIAWNASGGATVTSSQAASGSPGSPVWLQLARTGASTYTGAYSTTSAQGPWTAVGSVTVSSSAAASSQDVGLFAASGSAGAPALAGFAGFTVTG